MTTLASYTADCIRRAHEQADHLRRVLGPIRTSYGYARETRMDISNGWLPRGCDDSLEAAQASSLGQSIRDYERDIADLENVAKITAKAERDFARMQAENAERARIDAIFGRGARKAIDQFRVAFPAAAEATRYDVQMYGEDKFVVRAMDQHGRTLGKGTYTVR